MPEAPQIVVKKGRTHSGKRDFSFSREMVRTEGLSEGIRQFRLKAWETYQQMPLPTTKDEPWRRTDLSRLPVEMIHEKCVKGEFKLKPVSVMKEQGVIFTDLLTAEREYPHILQKIMGNIIKPEEGKFAAMAGSMAYTGALLYIPRGVVVEKPFHSLQKGLRNNQACFSHLLVYLEEGAEATYFHEAVSDGDGGGDCLHAGLVEIHVASSAKLRFIELQSWGRNVWNFTHERARVEQDGSLEWIMGSVGSKVTKNFSGIDLIGKGSTGKFAGFYFGDQNQHLDHDTQQNHLAANTTSDLLFKGAVLDESRAVWQGMVYVAPEAMKTDGYQSSRNLILSSKARVDAVPGLEILANDVRCSHGVTIGKVDEEQIFYLLSRGIPRNEAEWLIVEGFFDPILQRIPLNEARQKFQQAIQDKMTAYKK
jgi:Fe-S cluster assembly protein SufD